MLILQSNSDWSKAGHVTLLQNRHFDTTHVPSVDDHQRNTSLMDGGGSQQLAGESQSAGGVGRACGRVRRRQAVDRPVADLVGEVEHEARPVGERDDGEARAPVKADHQRLAVVERADQVHSTDARRRVDGQHHVHRLPAHCPPPAQTRDDAFCFSRWLGSLVVMALDL